MFARLFLLCLSVVSLAWIFYVGYDLLDQREHITPQRIFQVSDGEILIVNRSEEVHVDELDFNFNPETKELFAQLLQRVYQNEHIYLSENRPLILIELPRMLSQGDVKAYFKLKDLKAKFIGDRELTLGKDFDAKFKNNFLLIYPAGHDIGVGEEQEWPLWDNRASASIVQLNKPLKSTNIYVKANGTISYQTKYGKDLKCQKVDDADLFARVIPQKIENYHFYEKEYALKSEILASNSPLYNWMEEGMLEFEYEGKSCIISDYNKVEDPVRTVESMDQSAALDDHDLHEFHGIQLTNTFPGSESGFYISKFADKIILSTDNRVLEKIIADYEIGNTLALNQELMQFTYGKMPKKVSERFVTKTDVFSLSAFKNLMIKTQLVSEENALVPAVKNKPELTKNNSFHISGKIEHLLGNDKIVYCFTGENELLALANKKQIWKLSLDGSVLGKPKLIDVFGNGNQQLLFNTKSTVYLLNAEGKTVNSFPLTCPSAAPVSTYRWNGKTNFLVVNSNQDLLQIDQDGRILKKMHLNIGSVTSEVGAYRNGKVLTAIISGTRKTQSVDLDRNKTVSSFALLPSGALELKTDQGYSYFVLAEDGLYRHELSGSKSKVLGSKFLTNLKKITNGKHTAICFQDQQQVCVLKENGQLIKINSGVSELVDFDVLFLENGDFYLAILDGIENNMYLSDSNGKRLLEKSFEGKSSIKLSRSAGKYCLTSSLNNSIVQYFDVLP